jgi:hypothetical protein
MHELPETVVAIVDDSRSAQDGVSALAAAGFGAELLEGEEGRAHLDQENEGGATSVVRRLALAFGDELRILDRLGSRPIDRPVGHLG